MPQASRKLFQKFQKNFVQIPTQKSWILCFRLDSLVMHTNAHRCREVSNSLSLHPSKCHGNTSGRFSEFEKILAFLRKQEVGRQLAPIRTSGQHCPNTNILDREIACTLCIHLDNRTTLSGCGLVMAITCRQSATILTLRQHHLDAVLIWKRVKHIMKSQLHRRSSGRSM